MDKPAFTAFRCKLPRKPWLRNAAVRFYRDARSGRLLYDFIAENEERNAADDIASPSDDLAPIEPLPPLPDMKYDIFGGFSHNAIKASWEERAPQWILLQTYTGALLKQLPPRKKAPVVFPLADEDAYVYCDRPVCEKCLYCCKKGCNLFYYYGGDEIRILPLDQVSEYFRRKSR